MLKTFEKEPSDILGLEAVAREAGQHHGALNHIGVSAAVGPHIHRLHLPKATRMHPCHWASVRHNGWGGSYLVKIKGVFVNDEDLGLRLVWIPAEADRAAAAKHELANLQSIVFDDLVGTGIALGLIVETPGVVLVDDWLTHFSPGCLRSTSAAASL